MNRAALTALLALLLAPALVQAAVPDATAFYQISPIANPAGVDPQIGGMDVMADGRLAVAFQRGDVQFYDPKSAAWQPFAEGLHLPLGVLAQKDGSLLVMQRAELTRLRDTDADGLADDYQTVWDGFGMTGNYHEFAFGPAVGPDGKLYLSLNCASNGDTIGKEIRGQWAEPGLPREGFYKDWKKNSKEAGRMYSRVPWRGWVVQVDPATGKAVPWAGGFRSPDGIGFDAAGNLLVADNQGDWRGTSELHVVKQGGFYGHPASLVWRDAWKDGDPQKLPIAKLDALRTPAAVWFPHNIYANAPGQPVVIPKTAPWGPYGGQTLIGEMNVPRLLRVMLEETEGVWQGAIIPFIDTPKLKRGLNRMAFAGDTLWVGRIHLAWAGDEGISSILPTGPAPFDPLDIKVTPDGFRITFTASLDSSAQDPALWKIQRYAYAYHADYGSPQIGKTDLAPTAVHLDPTGITATLTLPEMKTGTVHDFDFKALRSRQGSSLLNPRLAYTLRRVPKMR
jgi:hypothetical protein